jgi:hypothetical protein
MVFIAENEDIVCNHISPKKTLDLMRYLCKGQTEPVLSLCRTFNRETHDGKRMDPYSHLLEKAIASIVHVKEEKDLQSFFTASETTSVINRITGLDDFELISFFVVR